MEIRNNINRWPRLIPGHCKACTPLAMVAHATAPGPIKIKPASVKGRKNRASDPLGAQATLMLVTAVRGLKKPYGTQNMLRGKR